MDENFNTNPNMTGDSAPNQAQPQEATGNTNAGYNSPYNGNYGAQTQSPYYTQQAHGYNSGSYNQNNTPWSAAQPGFTQGQPTVQYRQGKKQKKAKNTGKIIFIALISLCIVLSSIAIGSSLSGDNKNNSGIELPKVDSDKGNNKNNDGAQANAEDSPVSFSEYSGKGAMSSEQIYKEVKDINVGLLVYARSQKYTEGSGIIVGEDKSGKYTYILTAAHVIADEGISVQIQFSDETEAEAEIVGFDTKTDIGVVKVKKTGFKAATFGNSDKLTVGQKVYAIGNPGGTEFFGSFTSGMISAIDRPVPSANSTYDLPCIQHNAAINPGNSGGALVNEYGQVIGLNSSKISSTEYEGMGFSVPSNTVLKIYNDLISHGYVSDRPMLGITYFPVSSDSNYIAFALKNSLPYGSVVIASINANSDLAGKDIKSGDIIIAVNGEKLNNSEILLKAIENGKVGEELKLTIYRANSSGTAGSSFDVKVKLVEDRGDNVITTTEPETQAIDPFSYFEGFGY